jgi:hypothetical protein
LLTFDCLSFAEWNSAFSRRSPSSRAFWIAAGIVVLQLALEPLHLAR